MGPLGKKPVIATELSCPKAWDRTFRRYSGDAAATGTVADCSEPTEPSLLCGSIVYGIQFDFDSAEICGGSAQVLSALYQGLKQSPASSILIEGHTSSEGSGAYNQDLSERRVRSVIGALIERGLKSERIAAAGRGEGNPIASNEDEAGRVLNRRVEIAACCGC